MANLALLAACAATVFAGCSEPTNATAEPARPAVAPGAPTVVRAAFNEDCEDALIAELKSAKKEILIAIYNVTRRNITGSLAAAAKRGVKVTVKYDAGSMKDSKGMSSSIGFLKDRKISCIPVEVNSGGGHMHNKFAVIDRKVVVTGSFNYTSSASTVNYENVVVIESPELAGKFAEQFERIKSK